MSYEAAVLFSILRSLLAGFICTGLGRVLVAWRMGCNQLPAVPCLRTSVVNTLVRFVRARQCTSAIVLVPFFMPGLVVGYAYRNASLSLVQSPLMNELLYLAIVASQLVPVAVLTLEWLPPAVLGPSGVYCLQLATPLARSLPFGSRFRRMMVGEFPRLVTTGAVVALLCFQEVEVATLMQARGWAEWIFTKQAGGVELVDVSGALVLPVLYGVGLVVPVLGYWISGGNGTNRGHLSRGPAPGSVAQRVSNRRRAIVIMAIAWLLTVIWPITSLMIGAWRGAGVLQFRSAIWREIGDALVLAATVTSLLAMILWSIGRCQIVVRQGCSSLNRSGLIVVTALVVLLPGLMGSLALGLFLFEICQQIGWQPSYTPVPLVMGMVLFLLPRAIAMQAMMRWGEVRSDVSLAEGLTQLAGQRADWGAAILWKLRGAGRFWTLALLFWWSYLELTLPSLLRPAGMAPAPMRLYNFLHYGHIPGLAAMLALVLVVPLMLMAGAHSWLSRRFRTTLR